MRTSSLPVSVLPSVFVTDKLCLFVCLAVRCCVQISERRAIGRHLRKLRLSVDIQYNEKVCITVLWAQFYWDLQKFWRFWISWHKGRPPQCSWAIGHFTTGSHSSFCCLANSWSKDNAHQTLMAEKQKNTFWYFAFYFFFFSNHFSIHQLWSESQHYKIWFKAKLLKKKKVQNFVLNVFAEALILGNHNQKQNKK